MKTRQEELTALALASGADKAAVIDAALIPFHREFRELCAKNSCGKYRACWMCPPDVGDIDELMAKAQAYGRALVFQTTSPLEDSFDIEGMEAGAKRHNDISQHLAGQVTPLLQPCLQLAAGACQVCERCTRIDNEPCRYPEKALASLEAYGVAVSELAALCGMKYINGENTVTYFGAFLYNE